MESKKHYTPPKVGSPEYPLEKALGVDWAEFDKRMRLHEPLTVIARAIKPSYSMVRIYARVWSEQYKG